MQVNNITDKIRRAFTENLHLKAIAFAVAIILWVIVASQKNAEWAYLVPLEIKQKPDDIIITNNIPNSIDVRVQGSKSFIMGLKPEDIAVKLNLSTLEVGSNILPITDKNINLPRGARITRINPSYITLEAERLIKKIVKIKPLITGDPLEDYIVESVNIEPPVVEIMAAESEMKGIKFLRTGNINIAGAKEIFKKEVSIDTLGRKISLSFDNPIYANVIIREITARLDLRGLDVRVIKGGLKTEVKPLKVNLLLEGTKSAILSLNETDVVAFVDIRDLSPGTYNKRPAINLPGNITILKVQPKELEVKVWKKFESNNM